MSFGTTLEPALHYERVVRAPTSHRNWTMPIRPLSPRAYPYGTGRAMPDWGRIAITPNGQVVPLAGAYSAELGESQFQQFVKAGEPRRTITVGAISGMIIGGSGHRVMGAIGGALAGVAAAFYLGQIRTQAVATAAAVTTAAIQQIQATVSQTRAGT